jgi:small subunit ribosomal protein S4
MSGIKKARGKIVRRLGANIFGNPKFDRLLERKPHGPGLHGKRRKRVSDYGLQLLEKQKLRFCYGLTEKQFRTVFAKAKGMQGMTGENMLKLLECRLDNVVYRLGFANSRAQSRQMVKHGHFTLNGQKASSPSMKVSPNDQIAVKAKDNSQQMVKDIIESTNGEVPGWVQVDEAALQAIMIRVPERDEIPTVANEQLIVEFYSK